MTARPVTQPRHHTDDAGRSWTTRTVQRACNGCGQHIGDATIEEIERSIAGLPLEDVTGECGCTTERDGATLMADGVRVMERWRCRDCGYRAVDAGHPSIPTCPQCRGDYTWEPDREVLGHD